MVFCGCGRRMFGGERHNRPYYLCWPRDNNRGRPDKYEGHPRTVYLREDAVLDAVCQRTRKNLGGWTVRPAPAGDPGSRPRRH
ncbi:recombinase zinc beta ribbon domain-containing protein [Saccharopolyspora hattusasensis]|uniref:recombinase zinc beta ribbon domain-containing protein n=1 Tax=Saccharopolyspora hattusasensis TaxID=1128679 RepID=UPI003D9802CE